MKTGTSFRLSEEARRLVDRLTAKLGVSKTAVVEMAVRKLAGDEGVKEE